MVSPHTRQQRTCRTQTRRDTWIDGFLHHNELSYLGNQYLGSVLRPLDRCSDVWWSSPDVPPSFDSEDTCTDVWDSRC